MMKHKKNGNNAVGSGRDEQDKEGGIVINVILDPTNNLETGESLPPISDCWVLFFEAYIWIRARCRSARHGLLTGAERQGGLLFLHLECHDKPSGTINPALGASRTIMSF